MVTADVYWGVWAGAAPHMTSDDSTCLKRLISLAAISQALEGRHC